MPLSTYALAYAACLPVLLGLDAVWLVTMAERLYRPAIGHLMAERMALGPAALFYTGFVAGVVFFAVVPALSARRPWLAALGLGALLGLLAYAAYDLTNQATLRGWPWRLTLIDMAWGSTLTALSAMATAAAMPWLRARLGLD